MTRYKHLTIILAVFVMSTYSCNFVSGTAGHTAPRSAWIIEFFEKPVCQLPCWEKITPGRTTIAEAEEILKQNSLIEITNKYHDGIEWEYIPSGGQGYVESQHNENVVDIIYLGVSPDQGLTVSDVINSYAEPTYIHFEQNMHNLKRCFLNVYYEQLGLVISNHDLPCKETKQENTSRVHLEVSPETTVNSITMVTTGASLIEFAGSTKPIGWEGFGEYVKEYDR